MAERNSNPGHGRPRTPVDHASVVTICKSAEPAAGTGWRPTPRAGCVAADIPGRINRDSPRPRDATPPCRTTHTRWICLPPAARPSGGRCGSGAPSAASAVCFAAASACTTPARTAAASSRRNRASTSGRSTSTMASPSSSRAFSTQGSCSGSALRSGWHSPRAWPSPCSFPSGSFVMRGACSSPSTVR